MTDKKNKRLQKFLAESGLGSRRFCEDLIKKNQVMVNGDIAKLGCKVSSDDEVLYGGEVIDIKELKVILLNKPEGALSSNTKEKNRSTVFDFLPENEGRDWISIGRLDINSSGLMLFAIWWLCKLLYASTNGFDKEYLVRARGNFNKKVKNSMLNGINLDGESYKFSDIVEGEKKVPINGFQFAL